MLHIDDLFIHEDYAGFSAYFACFHFFEKAQGL